jgi:hypothetical protein
MRSLATWSMLMLCVLLVGCGVARDESARPMDPVEIATRAKSETNAAWVAKVNAMLASHAAAVIDLAAARDEAVKQERAAHGRVIELDAAIVEAHERNVARWLCGLAALCGIVAVGAVVLFFVFPAFGSLERGLATGCGVAACVLWWLGAHVHALPWIGGSVVTIGVCAAILKAGTLGAIVAKLHVARQHIRDAIKYTEAHHADAGATLVGALEQSPVVGRLAARVFHKA